MTHSEVLNAGYTQMDPFKRQIREKIILDLRDTLQRMRQNYGKADFYTRQVLVSDAKRLKHQLSVNIGLYRKEQLLRGIPENLVEALL